MEGTYDVRFWNVSFEIDPADGLDYFIHLELACQS